LNSFRNRLLAVVIGVLVLVQGATTFAVLARTRNELQAAEVTDMRARIDSLSRLMHSRYEMTATILGALTRDAAFTSALAERDDDAMRRTLLTYTGTLRAQVGLLRVGDTALLAAPQLDSIGGDQSELRTAVDAAVRDTRRDADALPDARDAYFVMGGRPFRLVLLQAHAHDQTAWVGAAFALDDNVAASLRALVGLDLSYRARGPDGKGYLASTLPQDLRTQIYSLAFAMPPDGTPQKHNLADTTYLSAVLPLDSVRGDVRIVAHKSMLATCERFAQLRLEVLLISGAALLLAAGAVVLLSRRALRPIDDLARAAQRIEQGHYDERVIVRGGREFEQLAALFDNMQRRIAERESRIVHQARHDQLTGLPNRIAARTRLARLIEKGIPVGLVLVDLRGFKHLNASFGHELGDQVLREIARRLAGAARSGDYVARVGTDQFLLLLRGSGVEHAESLAAQIVRGMRQGVLIGSIEVSIELHAGVCAQDGSAKPEELLRRADVALQEAKKGNLVICRYEPGHDESYRKRLQLLSDLHTAISSDQLSLVYQPKVLMADRRVRSLEALVRWTHPQLGPIPPAEFVALAEQTGNIGQLTRWVLNTAIAQLARWRSAGFESELAVNISASDLVNADLPDEILGLLARNDVLPRQLLLEITESAVMRELDKGLRVMRRLRDAGIRFAIDDFGTGHSSLAQLKALPVDELKIDRSFVRDLEQGTRDDAIVRSAVDLAHSLGLKVVAEGIETPAAWTALMRLGCDYAQGYFISRPLAPEQVGEWINEVNARLASAESGTAQVRVLNELRLTRRSP
jgi:diguanylate cyclase (GGDEF)-like protein